MASKTAAALLAFIVLPTSAAGADPYRWTFRPLYVFAPADGDVELANQRAVAARSAAGFRDRAIVVVYVVGDRVATEYGPPPGAGAAMLRNRFGVSPSAFRAVLVGKDGGAKLSSGCAISAERLSTTIDAMPMRRQEMRGRD